MKSSEARRYNPTAMPGLPEVPVTIEFGRFKVVRHRRELLVDARPVELGGRAFDTLVALIDARGTVLTKDELMSRVWPDRVVEENNLPAQIFTLRRVLGSDRNLIRTVAGRGYQFTGQVRTTAATAAGLPRSPVTSLPYAVSELIGREVELREVTSLVAEHRLVSLVGAGGIGKTRLAVEVARHLLPRFPDGVFVAELGPLSNPELVPATVASALGHTNVSRPRSVPRSFCCSSITVSTWSRRRPEWQRHCCAPARASRCSRPVASRSEYPVNRSTGSRHSMCQQKTPRTWKVSSGT